ncbi:MAG: DUF3179 domain-containing protein, partial [Cytophagaceae bacterium]|nr:DUF3179 domain-containing protein [Gemmatimonadaceae bacterium]
RRALAGGVLVAVAAFTYVVNFRMAADHMFLQPRTLRMVSSAENTVALDRLVVGVEVNGEARAYPLQYIGYHHQVRDTIGGGPIMVSYCTVCRTGRVFTPVVNGQPETFRLVGMDHWNAMFEDKATGSWWRQANGEAVTGPLKGTTMHEVPSVQVTLAQWLALHPSSLVMQADSAFLEEYAKDYSYERGTSRKSLTGTDTLSWGEKSWVIGITIGEASMAYDWNALRRARVINDAVGETPIVIVLAKDTASFFAFARPTPSDTFQLRGDSLVAASGTWATDGTGPSGALRRIKASQEFWHSWRTFQPGTGKGDAGRVNRE